MGRTATLTPEVEIESCPDYPRAFPFWNDVPILLLNHSNINNGKLANWITTSLPIVVKIIYFVLYVLFKILASWKILI